MNFIDRSAESIARSIRKNHPDAGSEIALKYAASLLINTLTAIAVSLLFCAVTGHLVQCAIAMVSFIIVRYVSGGMHMSSSVSCCMLSVLVFVTASHIDFNYSTLFVFIDIISMIVLFMTAPNDIKGVSSIDPKYYPVLKLLAVLFVSSNFYIQSTILSAAFIWEAFLTTPAAYKTRDTIERR